MSGSSGVSKLEALGGSLVDCGSPNLFPAVEALDQMTNDPSPSQRD